MSEETDAMLGGAEEGYEYDFGADEETGGLMPKPTTEILQHWVDTIQEEGLRLTPWEEEFVDSIAERLANRGSLSERQVEILERIYAEKTP